MFTYVNRAHWTPDALPAQESRDLLAAALRMIVPDVARVDFMKLSDLPSVKDEPAPRPQWMSVDAYEPYRLQLMNLTHDAQLKEMSQGFKSGGLFGDYLATAYEDSLINVLSVRQQSQIRHWARLRAMDALAHGRYPSYSAVSLQALGFWRRAIHFLPESDFTHAIKRFHYLAFRAREPRARFPEGACRLLPYGPKDGTYLIYVC